MAEAGLLAALAGNLLAIALDAAPWLLLGLVAAGLIKAWVPEGILQAWLGGQGALPVLRAALIGAPLPLCSCGAIPLGLALYRGGASRGATTAFMVGTPGVGVDSVTISYALLGPFMAVFRPLAAIFSAVVAGLLVNLVPAPVRPDPSLAACGAKCSCGSSGAGGVGERPPFGKRALAGLRYSFSEVLDDIAWWLLLGLLLAGLLLTIAPPGLLAQYALGPVAMLVMALIGIPMYLCAQAVTPVAAALIVAGVSPGTALVLLLAGPITSIATLSVLNREFGFVATAVYTLAVAATAIAAGLLADALITGFALDIPAQIGSARELLPDFLKYPALVLLLLLACRPLRRRFFRW